VWRVGGLGGIGRKKRKKRKKTQRRRRPADGFLKRGGRGGRGGDRWRETGRLAGARRYAEGVARRGRWRGGDGYFWAWLTRAWDGLLVFEGVRLSGCPEVDRRGRSSHVFRGRLSGWSQAGVRELSGRGARRAKDGEKGWRMS